MARRSPGGVYKRSGKTGWWASLTTSDGSKRVQLMLGEVREEALERYGEALRLKREGTLTAEIIDQFRINRRFKAPTLPTPKSPTLADAWDDWCAARSGKRSIPADESRWRTLLEFLPPSTELKTLTARQVDDAFRELVATRGITASTLNRFRALLRSMLKLAAPAHSSRRRALDYFPRSFGRPIVGPRARILRCRRP